MLSSTWDVMENLFWWIVSGVGDCIAWFGLVWFGTA